MTCRPISLAPRARAADGLALAEGLPARERDAAQQRVLRRLLQHPVRVGVAAAGGVVGLGVVAAGAAVRAALHEAPSAGSPARRRWSRCTTFAVGTSSFLLLHDAVLDAVVLLGALGVVETVERAHQIAGDAADALKGRRRPLPARPQLGAGVADDAVVAADRVAVDRVVDGAVADARVPSCTRTIFSKASRFLRRVAVQLHIGDVAGVGQRVVGRLELDLLKGADIGK